MARTVYSNKNNKNKDKLPHSGPPTRKKKKRRNWQEVADIEIRQCQVSTNMLLRRAPFIRLVREIAKGFKQDIKFTADAVLALQEASEAFLVGAFTDSVRCTIHRDRITTIPADLRLALHLRGDLKKLGLKDDPTEPITSKTTSLPET